MVNTISALHSWAGQSGPAALQRPLEWTQKLISSTHEHTFRCVNVARMLWREEPGRLSKQMSRPARRDWPRPRSHVARYGHRYTEACWLLTEPRRPISRLYFPIPNSGETDRQTDRQTDRVGPGITGGTAAAGDRHAQPTGGRQHCEGVI